METKFVSDFGEIDLSEIKITTQENNSRVSDQKFSKFMFPFDVFADQDFLLRYGDYRSYETADLVNKIPGYLVHENKVHDAVLFIQQIVGQRITAQIDFGFEELPNFDKKLSELPLEEFDVPDIYLYAKDTAAKKYPETNFNFPRIYTSKYPTTDEVWKNFDGYINDLKPDGSEMRRNYIDNEGGIWNVNIIHPCPHVLYVLKAGFADAGLTLSGDILTDPNLQQRWLFSGTEYFTSKQQRRYEFIFSSAIFDELYLVSGPDDYCLYQKYVSIEKAGRYKIAGDVFFWRAGKMAAHYELKLNGNRIWSKIEPKMNSTAGYTVPLNFEFEATENSVLELYIITQYHEDSWTADPLSNLRITSNVLDDLQNTTLGDDTGVITNLNEINLKKAVPEITFGEFVNTLTNWFNYDIEIRDKTVIMNRIQTEELPKPKDFRFMEIPLPTRVLLNKKSFLLKFPEMDEGYKKNSMFYDFAGAQLNGSAKPETSIIEANGYAMELKLPKPGGYLTANVMKQSDATVALVEYSGLTGGQNNATYSPGCDHPELFYNNWSRWLRIRINGQEFNWRKSCHISKISQYSVKDLIFCYNNIHIIKSMSKEKVTKDVYIIEIVTETVV